MTRVGSMNMNQTQGVNLVQVVNQVRKRTLVARVSVWKVWIIIVVENQMKPKVMAQWKVLFKTKSHEITRGLLILKAWLNLIQTHQWLKWEN